MSIQQKLDIHPLPDVSGPTLEDINPLTGWQYTGFKIKITLPAKTNPLLPLFAIKCTPFFIPPIYYDKVNLSLPNWSETFPIVVGSNAQDIVSVEIANPPCSFAALAMMHVFSTWRNFKLRLATSGNFVEKGSLYVAQRPFANIQDPSVRVWQKLPTFRGDTQGGILYGYSENQHAEGNFVQYDLSTNRMIEVSAPYLYPTRKFPHSEAIDGSWITFTPVTNLDVAGGSKVNLELAIYIAFDDLSFNAPLPWLGALAFPLSFLPNSVANYAYPIVLPDPKAKVDEAKGTFIPSSAPAGKEAVAEITRKFHGLGLG